MPQKKSTAKQKKDEKLVRYPSYEVKRKIRQEHEQLYYQLVTNKFGFDLCGKYRWRRRDAIEAKLFLESCKFTLKWRIPNLGTYKAELTNFTLGRDSDKQIHITTEVSVTRFENHDNSVTEFVYAPSYATDWGDTIYGLVDVIVGHMDDAVSNVSWEDLKHIPDGMIGDDLTLHEYEEHDNK